MNQSPENRHIALWLFTLAFFVALMVLVGGLTRLTDSGLSITEWRPITGIMPPLTAADWQSEFSKYQQIPEYQRVNMGMNLADFKFIYWWEWAHRFLGRIIGLIYAVPLLIFWRRGTFARAKNGGVHRPLLTMFALGGLGAAQGFMGWYMVKSGLVERVDVSQYRLAAHLGLAFIIFALCYWFGLSYWRAAKQRNSGLAIFSGSILGVLLLAQSLLGALVAGLHAGLSYNDWPFMDGDLWPSGLLAQSPVWRNFFENHLTVQFNHRVLAYVLVVLAAMHIFYILCGAFSNAAKRSAVLLAGAVLVQILLGILTLIWGIPMGLAVAHQLGAVLVVGLWVTHIHLLRYQ